MGCARRTVLAIALASALAGGCVQDPMTDSGSHGVLIVESDPPGAAIILDGTLTTSVTPQTFVNINAGVRDVRLSLAGFEVGVAQVLVTGGQVSRVFAQLKPLIALNNRPEFALSELAAAFSTADLDRYAHAIAEDFQFRLAQVDVDAGLPATLGRAQELGFVDSLIRSVGPSSGPGHDLKLTLDVTATDPDPRPGHAGWVRVSARAVVYARIQGGATLSSRGPTTLYVRRDTEAAGTWQAVEWVDDADAAPPAPGDVSLGRLRASYLPAAAEPARRPSRELPVHSYR